MSAPENDPIRRFARGHTRRKPRHPNGHGTHDRRGFYRSAELAHAHIAAVRAYG